MPNNNGGCTEGRRVIFLELQHKKHSGGETLKCKKYSHNAHIVESCRETKSHSSKVASVEEQV